MATESRFTWDVAERLGWTIVQFAAGLAITEFTDLDTWWAMPIGVALAGLKALAARRLGQPNTASTLSRSKDPAGPVLPRESGVYRAP